MSNGMSISSMTLRKPSVFLYRLPISHITGGYMALPPVGAPPKLSLPINAFIHQLRIPPGRYGKIISAQPCSIFVRCGNFPFYYYYYYFSFCPDIHRIWSFVRLLFSYLGANACFFHESFYCGRYFPSGSGHSIFFGRGSYFHGPHRV